MVKLFHIDHAVNIDGEEMFVKSGDNMTIGERAICFPQTYLKEKRREHDDKR
jgi:hypothetical protein